MLLRHAEVDYPEITGAITCPGCGGPAFMAECIHVEFQSVDENQQVTEHDFVICLPCLTKRIVPIGGIQ